MATAWDKLEQLLTCAICLDRFRNPKMLPCQHSFCQDPCMDGLQDYARRQIKCPECRAEHRIPFQGIQSYPTNVTLQRFLELHQSITGEEPDPVPTFMERCGVCSEKSSVTRCSHCDKKVCPECKEAHLDILKREISRICNQVRRALNRLQDALTQTERSVERLNINTVHMRDEIEEIVRRFVRDIKTQEEKLLKELESYSATESKTLTKMKEDLEIEFNNMKDNCDIAEKTLLDADKSWNDLELVECKDIFVKTLDFLRNFDADTVDYTRGMKFIPNTDLDALRRNLINFGELKLPTSDDVANSQVQRASSPLQYSGSSLSIPQQNMLMRSQSDHRLAAQFARRDSRLTDLVGPNSSRLGGLSDTEKDRGERSTSPNYGRGSRRDTDHRIGRYGTGDDRDASTTRNRFLRDSSDASSYRSGWSRPDTEDTYTGPQFKSRFMRDKGVELGFDDHDTFDMASLSSRSVRFEENAPPPPPSKVFDTESAPRGPLSGIIRIGDTAHFMERSHEVEARARVEKAREEEESRNPTPPVTRPSAVPPLQQPVTRRPPSRQVSEDEIEKQKKMNQAANAAMATAAAVATPQSYVASNQVVSSPPPPSVQPLPPSSIATPMSPAQPQAPSSGNKTPVSNTSAPLMSRRANMLRDEEERNSSSRQSSLESINPNRTLRDTDDDSLGDESSDMGLSRFNGPRRRRGSIDHEDSKDNSRSSQVSSISGASNTLGSTTTTTSGLRPVRAPLAKNVPIDEDEEKERETFRRRVVGPGPSLGIDRNEDEDDAPVSTPTYRSRYAEANYGKQARYQYKTRDREKTPPPMSDDTNGTTGTSAWSSYLRNKYGSSRTSSVGSSGTGSGRTGLSKSKSSHAVYSRTISDSSDDEPAALRSFSRKASVTTTSLDRDSVNASSTTASTRGSTATTGPSATTGTSSNSSSSTNYSFSLPRNMYMQKKRMMFKVGTRGTEPGCFTWPRGIAVAPDNTIVVADSSNHRVQVFGSTGRFLFEFGSYGSGEGEFDCLAGVAVNRIGQFIVSDRYNHRVQIFDPSGRFLRAFGCEGRMDGRFSYPWGITTDSLGFIYVCDKENHRIQVFQSDGTFVGKFGSIGTKAGQLEHPHYIAVSNTNRVFVSDSNNHRIQIFDVNGRSLSTFGSEGSEEGQFKFPRGLAVDDQGYIIVGDSGNNRIQIFSPDGTFLKAFGSWGSGESEFKGLEGVAVSSTGNILVCDRENHRIQVF
ncbi:tripartite motif containing protein thin isoform X3 [Brevipalpus obovatus]|uniref:tripartite motif containing protein thin isoform X3 n=1 Tax=Brevipalpus obovatus TaxID=246614 RepID=UPI003D9DE43F